MMNRTRVALLLVISLAVLVPAPARAQSFEIYLCDENQEALDSVEVTRWTNRARCLCDETDSDPDTATMYLSVKGESPYTSDLVYFYLGDDCDDAAVTISEKCHELDVIEHSALNVRRYIPLPVNYLVDPVNGICTEQDSGSSNLYVIMADPNTTAVQNFPIAFDTGPGKAPEDVKATPGERSITVTWSAPSGGTTNIEYYDILCSLGGRPPAGVASVENASWVSTRKVCGRDVSIGSTTQADAGVDAGVSSDASVVADAGVADAAVDAAPADAATSDATAQDCATMTGGFVAGEDPNPCFVCGSVSAGSASLEYRIRGLTNNLEYAVAVVAVDKYFNPSPVSAVDKAIPVPTTDFAEQYTEAGGKETGGFCFVATAVYGSYDHPEVVRLRDFRDGALARTDRGRAFVSWYYREGPALAAWVESSVLARLLVRVGLELTALVLPRTRAAAAPSPAAMLPVTLLLFGLIGLLGARLGRRTGDGPGPEVRR